jgi:hypothetical protein
MALLFPLLLLSFPLLSSLLPFVVLGCPLLIIFVVVGFREILDACFAPNLPLTALNVNVFRDILYRVFFAFVCSFESITIVSGNSQISAPILTVFSSAACPSSQFLELGLIFETCSEVYIDFYESF